MTGMLVWVWACFWPCHGFLMKKFPEWKFFIFESRTFWNKFHFIWIKGTQDIACFEEMIPETEILTCVLARFWLWYSLFLENCWTWKFLHFESSLILYKVHLIWINETQDISCLVHIGHFWTVCKEATIAFVNWDILRKWWTWKLLMIWWSSSGFKLHAFWIKLCSSYVC